MAVTTLVAPVAEEWPWLVIDGPCGRGRRRAHDSVEAERRAGGDHGTEPSPENHLKLL